MERCCSGRCPKPRSSLVQMCVKSTCHWWVRFSTPNHTRGTFGIDERVGWLRMTGISSHPCNSTLLGYEPLILIPLEAIHKPPGESLVVHRIFQPVSFPNPCSPLSCSILVVDSPAIEIESRICHLFLTWAILTFSNLNIQRSRT